MSAAADDYDALAETLVASEPDVQLGRAFRDGVLKVWNADGKPRIFAMPDDGGIVLKLPAERCGELVATLDAAPFRRGGQGAPMREWVIVGARHADAWPDLAREALAFVRG